MGKITIITESTADLSPKLIKDYDIKVLPLYVTFGDKIYEDGVDLTTAELYEIVDKNGKLPKTSAGSVGDYINIFNSEIEKGNEVVLVAIGNLLSSTYKNAILARDEVDSSKIEIINSENLSTAIGLLVLKACKLRDAGKNIHEIKEEVDKLVPNLRAHFAIESLEYLHKGGRCSGIGRLIGTLLQIKPVIAVENGALSVADKPRGKKKALKYMYDDIVANKDNVDLDCIMVTHSFADEEAVELKSKLEETFPDANVEITNAGCVISSHCGRGTIGILYLLK